MLGRRQSSCGHAARLAKVRLGTHVLCLPSGQNYLESTNRGVAMGEGGQKKVMVLVGSPHKGGATYLAAQRFVEDLESFGDVQGEIVGLGDFDIRTCRGCKLCFERGEEHCPLKDDRDLLIEEILESDAVVFASPNYSFQVSGVMKTFLDRLGFLFHRPRFHGKTYSAIVVQGIHGGRRIRDYLEFVGGGLGFNVVRGSVVRTLEPMSDTAMRKMDRLLAAQSLRLHDRLLRSQYPRPSHLALMIFRTSRTRIRRMLPDDHPDAAYYRERGWFEAGYYYPVRLGVVKRLAGAVYDLLARMSSPRRAPNVDG